MAHKPTSGGMPYDTSDLYKPAAKELAARLIASGEYDHVYLSPRKPEAGRQYARVMVIENCACCYSIAHAAATDEANRKAASAGRKTWNAEDYNTAVEAISSLLRKGIKQ